MRSIDLRVRLRPSEAEKLRELAAKDGETTVSALVRRAISRYIEQVESPTPRRRIPTRTLPSGGDGQYRTPDELPPIKRKLHDKQPGAPPRKKGR